MLRRLAQLPKISKRDGGDPVSRLDYGGIPGIRAEREPFRSHHRHVVLVQIGSGEWVKVASLTNWWPVMGKRKGLEGLFDGRHFDREIIVLCVRWYLRYKLSLRDLVAWAE